VAAEAADGSLGREERAAIIDRFRRGETQALCNCELFTEGFDVPEAACALLLRPTQSWSLYVQMVGRVMRLAPGKPDCIVIDVVDLCNRHSLATVPAILDLPPGLDLQGQSLAKAAAAMDEMGAKAGVLQKALPGSWSELQTLLRQVDLFANIEPAMELQPAAFSWLSIPGGYQVGCGSGKTARLQQDELGHWRLTLWLYDEDSRRKAPLGYANRLELGPERIKAAMHAERIILQHWPQAGSVALREARWREAAPSDKQLALLRKLGQSDAVLASLTKGQASGLIDQLLSSRREPAGARR